MLLLLVLGLAAIGGGAFVLLRDSGPTHPDTWDPRVTSLVDFVERSRGLAFRHPVAIDFLSDAAFADAVRVGETDLTVEERALLDNGAASLRSLGLGQGDLDVLDASNDLQTQVTLAFYDPRSERITVRGEQLDVARRVTLVHELVHALQDQQFGLRTDFDDTGAQFAYRVLAEGDATIVENQYLATLDDAERAEYASSLNSAGGQIDLTSVPAVLQITGSAPYDLGPAFVDALMAQGGLASRNRAFEKPPISDEQVLDPLTYLGGDEPVQVDAPATPDGAEVLDDSDFGALAWFVMLSERIDPHLALRAADGWGGDRAVTYRRADGTVCTSIAWRGDASNDAAEMSRALDAWVAEMPDARVEDGATTTLTSCDPGPAATLTRGQALPAYALPVVRSGLFGRFLDQGLAAPAAWCTADTVVAGVSVADIRAGRATSGREYDALAAAAEASCAG